MWLYQPIFTFTPKGMYTLCYAVNDASEYINTYLSIDIRQTVVAEYANLFLSSTVQFLSGSRTFYENWENSNGEHIIEYTITLNRLLTGYEEIQLRLFDEDWQRKIYPKSCLYYHPIRESSDCIRITIDGYDVNGKYYF